MARVPFTAQLRRDVEATHGRVCWLCLLPISLPARVSLDHVIPVQYGGTNAMENLRPAHKRCNTMRSDWDVASYYAWAIDSGIEDRVALVPDAYRDVVARTAATLHRAARTHYARRDAVTGPLGGTWAYQPT